MKKTLNIWIDFLLTVTIPLFLGWFIYYWTRQHSIHFLSWIDQQLNMRPVTKLHLPSWVTFHLPDGLWTFAFCSLLLILWRRRIDIESIVWLSIPLLTAVFLEFSIGTFDIKDLLFILLGGLLAFIAHPKNKFYSLKKINQNEQN
ncbi:MAG: hypothetical protein WCP74_13395 [Sphingobacteriia bacterium]|jgi:glycopeptide antibiotics resistance protein